jgi:hypothetical protein
MDNGGRDTGRGSRASRPPSADAFVVRPNASTGCVLGRISELQPSRHSAKPCGASTIPLVPAAHGHLPSWVVFALARLVLDLYNEGMDKPHTRFEPIQLDDSRWYVRITLPHGVQQRINSFETEAEARSWIGEYSVVWSLTSV